MNQPSPYSFTPETDGNRSGNEGPEPGVSDADIRRIIEQMYTRQQQLEAELAETRAAFNNSEAARRQTAPTIEPLAETTTNTLLRDLLRALTANNRTDTNQEPAVPREWKPPSWDGKAETFRDYLLRLRSSYRVRAASNPPLPENYYWNAIYDTLPSRERARMRHFWEKGSTTNGKDPEGFFKQLEAVFADTNEQAKALESLSSLKHSVGQPWHEHQLEFDGLLLSAGGDSWPNPTKIGYLKNTFSNPAKMYTATMAKTEDYYTFSEEVERIMTNLEGTDQFKAAYRRWAREKSRDTGAIATVTARVDGYTTTAQVDAEGDTVMAPTQFSGNRYKRCGDRKSNGSTKQKAKWVDTAERERRKEERLCFRCGAAGHRIRECPYAAPTRPSTTINATFPGPLLETEQEASASDISDQGKEQLPLRVRRRE
jgi:hypothetical protein